MTLDWTNAEYASGPALYAWLSQHDRVPAGSKLKRTDPTLEALLRRMQRWRSGENASLDTVDRYMVYLGYHISDLPNEVWIPKPIPRKVGRAIPAEIKEAALEAFRAGGRPSVVAREFGVSEHSLHNWRRRAAA